MSNDKTIGCAIVSNEGVVRMRRALRKNLKTKLQPEDYLTPLGKAVNEAAARVRGLWLGYIALLAYLFVAVGAVTHQDLLLKKPVKLPVLNVELPLIGFFAVAPAFLLINHFYLLIHLMGLSRRLKWFNDAITKSQLGEDAQRRQRSQLDTFVIVQMLAGTKEERELRAGWFLNAIALFTVVFSPVALLLFIQLQFLPFQYWLVTWLHRGLISIDLVLLWVFWPSIRLGVWVKLRDTFSCWATVPLIMIFSFAIASFPGEFAYEFIKDDYWNKDESSFEICVKGQLFDARYPNDPQEGVYPLPWTLNLSDNTSLIDLNNLDKIKDRHRKNDDRLKPWETGRTLNLRERNLRCANLERADLRNVDLYRARLQDASLFRTRLWGSSLKGADLRNAVLIITDLRGASLEEADLRDATLYEANLQSASLDRANLQGAFLSAAILQGASLELAKLQGASLDNADLRGASLSTADVQGASLYGAKLQGASLDNADLRGAYLDYADLRGASLENADLRGASLDYADLRGTSLENAKFQGASMVNTLLWRAHGDAVWHSDLTRPLSNSPTLAFIIAPQLGEMTPAEITEMQLDATFGIQDENTKRNINKRLARLLLKDADLEDDLPEGYWTRLTENVSKEEYQRDLAKRLRTLACGQQGAPNIAKGLLKHRLAPPNLKPLAESLLDAAKDADQDCPGLKGLTNFQPARSYLGISEK